MLEPRSLGSVVWGVFLVVLGLAFAGWPIGLARFTNQFRSCPFPGRLRKSQVTYFRSAGVAIAALGALIILL
jgi:hypothetical protein